MLSTLVDEPFSNENWLYEIKWDGYRALAYMDKHHFELLSRNNLSFAEKYKDENTNVTDTDAAETSQRVRHASQVSGNDIEEGDEDYDDENEENKI